MITIDEVTDQIRRCLRGRAPATALRQDTRLSDLGLSSLQISEILFRLEEDHEREFDTARAARVQTVGDIMMLSADSG